MTHSTAFISILDAYHAPYSRKHRYWTGFMLLTRCILFLAFAINSRSDKVTVNTFITTIVVSAILLLKTCSTEFYRSYYLNALELSFLFNLEILSAILYYLKGLSNKSNVACKITNASISTSFVIFIGILVYHFYLQIRKTRLYSTIKRSVLNKFPRQCSILPGDEDNAPLISATSQKAPTTSHVKLREELLSSDDSN